MIDTKAAYSSLLNDPKLDALLADAQTKIAAQGVQTDDGSAESINQVADDAQKAAAAVRVGLIEQTNAKIALRKEKVAIAVHMMKVATRLSA